MLLEASPLRDRSARVDVAALAADALQRRLGAVRDLALREVAAAREPLQAVEALAEEHGEALATLTSQLRPAAGGPSALGRMLQANAARTAAFIEQTRERLASMRAASRDSLRLAEELGAVSQGIDEVSDDAGLLALNAQLTSAGLGEHGRVASVIAARMRTLAREIAASNEQLGAVALAIARDLPSIDQHVARSEAEARTYLGAAERLQRGVQVAFDALRADVEAAARSGRERSEVVLREVADILAHLHAHDAVVPLLEAARAVTPPTASADAEARRRAELAAWSEGATRHVEAAIGHSLAHIGPVAAALTTLNEGARAYVAALAEVCARVAPETTDAQGYEAQQAALVASLEEFVRAATAETRAQRDVIVAATERAGALGRALEQTQGFALEASTLGVATKLESARMGGAGAEFRAIGARLEALNAATRRALSRGRRFVKEIRGALSSMLLAATASERELAAFAREQAAALEAYRAGAERTTTAAREAVSASRGRADRMLEHCFEAIVHLQFQDRITQELNAVRRLIQTTERLGGAADAEAGARAVLAIDAIPTFLEPAERPRSSEDLASGDVMMF